jgi:hypothetical protein
VEQLKVFCDSFDEKHKTILSQEDTLAVTAACFGKDRLIALYPTTLLFFFSNPLSQLFMHFLHKQVQLF